LNVCEYGLRQEVSGLLGYILDFSGDVPMLMLDQSVRFADVFATISMSKGSNDCGYNKNNSLWLRN